MKKIKFHPVGEAEQRDGVPPLPAKEFIPRWYKDLTHFYTKKPEIRKGMANPTVKSCMPFQDAMTAGYIQSAWQDMSFDFLQEPNGDETVYFGAPSETVCFNVRDGNPSVKLSDDYYPFEFVFHPPFYAELPKGWSLLITQPINVFDSPLMFTSGIIDSDLFTRSSKGNLPFFVKRGFSGVIPKGTPLFQMIPIKRENWISEVEAFDAKKQSDIMRPIYTKFWGGYKHTYWQKKSYK